MRLNRDGSSPHHKDYGLIWSGLKREKWLGGLGGEQMSKGPFLALVGFLSYFLCCILDGLFTLMLDTLAGMAREAGAGLVSSFSMELFHMVSLAFLTTWQYLGAGFLPVAAGFAQKECSKRPRQKAPYN